MVSTYLTLSVLVKIAVAVFISHRFFRYVNVAVDVSRRPSQLQYTLLVFASLGCVAFLHILEYATETVLGVKSDWDSRIETTFSLIASLAYVSYFHFMLIKSQPIRIAHEANIPRPASPALSHSSTG